MGKGETNAARRRLLSVPRLQERQDVLQRLVLQEGGAQAAGGSAGLGAVPLEHLYLAPHTWHATFWHRLVLVRLLLAALPPCDSLRKPWPHCTAPQSVSVAQVEGRHALCARKGGDVAASRIGRASRGARDHCA